MVGSVSSVEQRFGCFFAEHSTHVRNYTMTLVVDDEVDDVVQRAFLIAWQRYDDIPDGSEREWLFGVVRNHCRNTWRTDRRAKALVAAIEHNRHFDDARRPGLVVLDGEAPAVQIAGSVRCYSGDRARYSGQRLHVMRWVVRAPATRGSRSERVLLGTPE